MVCSTDSVHELFRLSALLNILQRLSLIVRTVNNDNKRMTLCNAKFIAEAHTTVLIAAAHWNQLGASAHPTSWVTKKSDT